uniref:Uncharacterized protein n=1 Tax=Chondria tumulosa TaxID=2740715 RepID=A0A896ST01_9FLOR|nr:hypothetical protein K8K75_pgp124 [Chondria tumulosa]QSD57083.1 hypothetical protein [Chondria tumulosa]
MKSSIGNLNKYNEDYIDYDVVNSTNNTEEVEIPMGLSVIYLNETINYYTDCNSKKLN